MNLENCKRADQEGTYWAIWDGLKAGTVELPEDSDFHHDDVGAIEKWVEQQADELHEDDD